MTKPKLTDDELLSALDIDDSYTVVRVLAEHKVGATELVRSPQGRLCVRKRIPQELANREAWETLRNLSSPLLPQVERLYELPDVLVVVCPYVPGTSVGELLESGTRIAPAEAAAVIGGVCDALAILHDDGIVHRDVSPGNVIIAPDVVGGGLRSRTRLIDLGVARLSKDRATHDTTPLGTRGFSAPEQYGFAQTDARSDIYSAGRLLLCLLCGRIVDDMAPSLDDLMAEQSIPIPLRDIVRTACAFEPSARYQDVRAMGAALAQAERALLSTPAARPAYAVPPAGMPAKPAANKSARPTPTTGYATPSSSQPSAQPRFTMPPRSDVPRRSAPPRTATQPAARRSPRRRALNILMWLNLLVAVLFGLALVSALTRPDRMEYLGADVVILAITVASLMIAWFIFRFLEADANTDEDLPLHPLVLKFFATVAVVVVVVCIVAIIVATAKR